VSKTKQSSNTNKKTNNNKINRTFLDYYRVSVPLLKSLIWPILILSIALIFKSPINVLILNINDLIIKTSGLQYKSLAFEIEEAIAYSSKPEVNKGLDGISDVALFTIIELGNTPDSPYAHVGHISWDCPQSKRKLFKQQPELKELEKRKLISISDYSYEDCTSSYQWKWTDLGLSSHKAFMDILISNIIKDIQIK